MADDIARTGRRRERRRINTDEVTQQSQTEELRPSIATLRGHHRAAHPDEGTILEAASHLKIVKEWPITCPRFLQALELAGIESIRYLQFIKLDHHLITALVERWCPQTNTFHLPVGEMTITLQDVQVILGIKTDGEALVGPVVVGPGKRWASWPACCDELLGAHPEQDIIYHEPIQDNVESGFRMGHSHAHSIVPLRWLRWTFQRESYDELPDIIFVMHVRAYILYILGCFLLPDTSGSHVHLQFLPLLENIEMFSQYSIGGAVLAHLYREMNLATKPTRVTIAGCLHVLQVWSWERIHVGRPVLHVPFPRDISGKPIGYRWNEERVRQMPIGNVAIYRDEIDGLRRSQVIWEPYSPELMVWLPPVCLDGFEIWTARVPLVCWKRVEWHLPDRVMRQFGGSPSIDIHPIPSSFKRVDGRGRADVDWMHYHHASIIQWDNRREHITLIVPPQGNGRDELIKYLRWYKSWALLYLLKAPIEAPDTYYPRSPGERMMVDYFVQTKGLVDPFLGGHGDNASSMQLAMNEIGELAERVDRSFHIDYDDANQHASQEQDVELVFPSRRKSRSSSGHESRRRSTSDVPRSSRPASSSIRSPLPGSYTDVGTSIIPSGIPGHSNPQWTSFQPTWNIPAEGPSNMQVPYMHMPYAASSSMMSPSGFPIANYPSGYWMPPLTPSVAPIIEEQDEHDIEQQQPRGRPVQPPDRYTPGSGAIPRRHKKK